MKSVAAQRGSWRKRLGAAGFAITIIATATLTVPSPAVAARNVPWRFANVTLNSSISGAYGAEPIKGWTLQCPAGYTAVSGGIVGGDDTSWVRKLLEYPNPADGTFHVSARNYGIDGTTIKLAATCVWLDDIGTVTTVYTEFARNGDGRAGGTVSCPDGTVVLSGGVDWSNSSTGRTIDYSSPADGGGTSWYVAGHSWASGVLAVELRCVSSSLLVGEYATTGDSLDGSPGYAGASTICASGYRILTGGVAPAGSRNPGADQGHGSVSGPLDFKRWRVGGYQPAGVTLRAIAYCVPASTASVELTQTPLQWSTSRSGSITFSASDTADEMLRTECSIDGFERSCQAGIPVGYDALVDGLHNFAVQVANESGSLDSAYFAWYIDATAPIVTDHTPMNAASLTGPLAITFSEAVKGLTASSIVVHAETANVDVAGTVAQPSPTTAIWTPTARLVPGETYRVSLTSAISDLAGNALIPTYYTVRATTLVENDSVALTQLWDRDAGSLASGGFYVASRQAGSRAELTFTATAGQKVAIYGIRMSNGGYADIYLDGVKKATASFYASSTARARVYLSGALSAGKHTISIRPTGTKPAASSGAWVRVDNVNVGAAVKQETALRQAFLRVANANAYGGSYDAALQAGLSDSTPAQFRLAFVGSGVKVYATKSPTAGRARIYVDGILKATVNLNASSTAYKVLVYSAALPAGSHVIRIEAVGTSSGATSNVPIDRIVIT